MLEAVSKGVAHVPPPGEGQGEGAMAEKHGPHPDPLPEGEGEISVLKLLLEVSDLVASRDGDQRAARSGRQGD
jgi:hypothetical protein